LFTFLPFHLRFLFLRFLFDLFLFLRFLFDLFLFLRPPLIAPAAGTGVGGTGVGGTGRVGLILGGVGVEGVVGTGGVGLIPGAGVDGAAPILCYAAIFYMS
jgi:hypothetical protein